MKIAVSRLQSEKLQLEHIIPFPQPIPLNAQPAEIDRYDCVQGYNTVKGTVINISVLMKRIPN